MLRKLKNRLRHFLVVSAEVAQPGRALDSLFLNGEGEAEDRVVAGSNPALGTFNYAGAEVIRN